MVDKTHALEPRLAKVEGQFESLAADMDVLAKDLRQLTGIVRTQGEQLTSQIQALSVSVTQAQAPRATDWQSIIAAVGLVLAIGTAAMSPLYLRMRDAFHVLEAQAGKLEEHTKLKLHPVGENRIDALEADLSERARHNAGNIQDLQSLKERIVILETKAKGAP